MRTDRRTHGKTRPSVPAQTGKSRRRSHQTGAQPRGGGDRRRTVWGLTKSLVGGVRTLGAGAAPPPRATALASLTIVFALTLSSSQPVGSVHACPSFLKLPEALLPSGRGALGSPWADPTAEPPWRTRPSPLPRGSTAGPHEAHGPSWGEDSWPRSFLGQPRCRRSPWSPPGEMTGTERGSHPTRLWWERNEGLHAFTVPETGSTSRTFRHDSNPLSLPATGHCSLPRLRRSPATPAHSLPRPLPSAAGPRAGCPHQTHGLCSWPWPAGRERVSVPASLCGQVSSSAPCPPPTGPWNTRARRGPLSPRGCSCPPAAQAAQEPVCGNRQLDTFFLHDPGLPAAGGVPERAARP